MKKTPLILIQNSIFKCISQFILSEKYLILTMWTSRLLVWSGTDVANLRTFEAKISLCLKMSDFYNNIYEKQGSVLASWKSSPSLLNSRAEQHSICNITPAWFWKSALNLWIKRFRPLWQLLTHKGYWIVNYTYRKYVFSSLADWIIHYILCRCLWYDDIPEKSWNTQ